jgi:anti-sigma regulatory factor (Ser/Thr protein kinase)
VPAHHSRHPHLHGRPLALRRWHAAPVAESVPEARRFVARTVAEWGLAEARPDLSYDAQICVSELVTNVIRHADAVFVGISVAAHAEHLRIEVSDSDPGSLPPVAPAFPAVDQESGRGLLLVALLASDCGWLTTPRGKTAWVELPLKDSPLKEPSRSSSPGALDG